MGFMLIMLIKPACEINPGNILVVEGYNNHPNKYYIVLSVKNHSDITITIKLLTEELKVCVWYKGFEEKTQILL